MTVDAADQQGAHGVVDLEDSYPAPKATTFFAEVDPRPASTDIRVFVPGKPAPQGSKKAIHHKQSGKIVTMESSKAVRPWRQDIRHMLLAELEASGQTGPLEGAVSVCLNFVMPRPASTPKRRTPPAIKRPDIDKLCRAVLDAIASAGVYRDDSQVIALAAYKRIAQVGETPGVEIRIEQEDGNYVE